MKSKKENYTYLENVVSTRKERSDRIKWERKRERIKEIEKDKEDKGREKRMWKCDKYAWRKKKKKTGEKKEKKKQRKKESLRKTKIKGKIVYRKCDNHA